MSLIDRISLGVLIILAIFVTFQYLTWWFSPSHLPQNQFPSFEFGFFGKEIILSNYGFGINVVLFIMLSFVVHIGLAMKFLNWILLLNIKKPVYIAPADGLKVAFLTCFVPGKEPLEMLEKTIVAMQKVKYPHDTWVLDEGNMSEVRELCEEYGVKHYSRKEHVYYNHSHGTFKAKTKGGNLNAWRDYYEYHYDVIAQIDMDHVPTEQYLTRTLGYFRDPEVGFVVLPQVYRNKDNWIARGAAEQTYMFYGPIQMGLFGCDIPFLTGTTHMYRREAMESIKGYASNIAEDYLTGVHLYSNKWKGVYVPEILATGEGPQTWVDYFNQQLRWSYGMFEILFKHSPKLIHKLKLSHILIQAFIQLFYFSGVSVFVGSLLILLYLCFGINTGDVQMHEWISYFAPFLIVNVMIQLIAHKHYLDPKNEKLISMSSMILGLGASLIYSLAFIYFITGKKLKYAVTRKGAAGNEDTINLKIFSFHILNAVLLLGGLVMSFMFGHDSLILRFWAVASIVGTILLILTVLSTLVPFIYNRHKNTTKYNFDNKSDFLFLHEIFSIKKHFHSETVTFFGFMLCLIAAILLFIKYVFNIPVLLTVSAGISFFYLLVMIFKIVVVGFSLQKQYLSFEQSQIDSITDDELPIVTILVPLYNEAMVVPQIITSLSKIDYPKEKIEIIITLEEYDKATIDAIRKENPPLYFKQLVLPNVKPKTKPKALNVAFLKATGEIIVIYDAEILPDRDQLKKAYLAFKQYPNISCLQTRLDHYNHSQNSITKHF